MAVDFGSNTTADFITIPQQNIITANVSDRTIALWFKADNTTDRQVLYEEGGMANGINIYLLNGKVYVHAWEDQTERAPLSVDVIPNEWYHVAMVLDAGLSLLTDNFKLYLDGSLVDYDYSPQLINGVDNHNFNIHIGFSDNTRYVDTSNPDNTAIMEADFYFGGVIDEFELWNSALTDAQIALEMWNQTSGAASPIVHYDFNNDTGSTIDNTGTWGATLDGTTTGNVTHTTDVPIVPTISWAPGGMTGSPVSVSPGTTTNYTYTLTHATTNGEITYGTGTIAVTVNPLPTITVSNSEAKICEGDSPAVIAYSAITNSPDQYSIDFDTTAEGQGFTDVSAATLRVEVST
ncbi:MAG: LamG domain-containing protein [Mangrovibacterium sp.]